MNNWLTDLKAMVDKAIGGPYGALTIAVSGIVVALEIYLANTVGIDTEEYPNGKED